MSVTVIDPRVHYVKETGVARFFRRRLRDPNLVTFWHGETGQWILAYWLDRRQKIVDEIEDLGPRFEEVTASFVQMIVSCYGKVDMGRTKKRLIGKHRERIQKQSESICEDQERWDWAKKRTKEKAPLPYAFQ